MKKLMTLLAVVGMIAAAPAKAAWDGDLTNADVDAVLTFLASPLVDGEVDEGDDIEADGAFDDIPALITALTPLVGAGAAPTVAALVSADVNADQGIPEIAEWRLMAAAITANPTGPLATTYGATYAAVEANLSTTLFAGQEPALDLVTILCVKNAVSGALYIDAQGVGTTLATILPAPFGPGPLAEFPGISAGGDYDGDGESNYDEWNNAATSIGLDAKAATFSEANGVFKLVVNQFVQAALDPSFDGTSPTPSTGGGVPVGGALGLGLLTLLVASGGAVAVRRK